MRYRTLGRTGISVSEIGYGAWGIGQSMWIGADDKESLRALHTAIDKGLNFIDTAMAYGRGHSEQLIGRVLKERTGSTAQSRAERIYVATKISPMNQRWPAQEGTLLRDAFPATHIIECTEKSLKNLNIDCIDLQQFHVWIDEWSLQNEWWDAVSKLKEQGKIRFVGISVNDHQPHSVIEAAKSGRIDSFQVIYNIFDQSPEDELLPLCRKENIGILARVPFDEGSLAGQITPDTIFPEGDWRHRYFRDDRKHQVWERVRKIEKEIHDEAADIAEFALRYILSNPAVSTVIPGMRTVRNVERNCAVSDGRLLRAETLQRMKDHRWVRNFYS
jgi:aryl-alcohol dehydrogenase-like predicted oxidoreductase